MLTLKKLRELRELCFWVMFFTMEIDSLGLVAVYAELELDIHLRLVCVCVRVSNTELEWFGLSHCRGLREGSGAWEETTVGGHFCLCVWEICLCSGCLFKGVGAVNVSSLLGHWGHAVCVCECVKRKKKGYVVLVVIFESAVVESNCGKLLLIWVSKYVWERVCMCCYNTNHISGIIKCKCGFISVLSLSLKWPLRMWNMLFTLCNDC